MYNMCVYIRHHPCGVCQKTKPASGGPKPHDKRKKNTATTKKEESMLLFFFTYLQLAVGAHRLQGLHSVLKEHHG